MKDILFSNVIFVIVKWSLNHLTTDMFTTEHVTIFGKLAKQIQSFCSTNKVIAIRINETFNETFIFWCLLKK